jgi:16S rRNA (cytidine1402-2'-O)-methyltransferase
MPSNSPIPNPVSRDGQGRLYVVATPIGNLDDITLRALKVMKAVDLIAAEDTRHTQRLLKTHHIDNHLISYHEHNEQKRTVELLRRLQAGAQIALVTNAGTPLVSDPGYRLVRAALNEGIDVIPIPGACAAIAALSASGQSTDRFTFVGFPARKKAKRRQQLTGLAQSRSALIFYQSPRRIVAFLEEIKATLGDRYAVVAREITKIHEEFLRGSVSDIIADLEQRDTVKGECTLIVSGAPLDTPPSMEALEQAIADMLDHREGSLGTIAKTLAGRFGLPRNTVYAKALEISSGRQRKD